MKNLNKLSCFSNNLINKRNFFVNLLILSSLSFVFFKNIDKVRYSYVTTEKGEKYLLDRFSSTIRLVKK